MWNSYPFYVTHLVKLFGVVVKRKEKNKKEDFLLISDSVKCNDSVRDLTFYDVWDSLGF